MKIELQQEDYRLLRELLMVLLKILEHHEHERHEHQHHHQDYKGEAAKAVYARVE